MPAVPRKQTRLSDAEVAEIMLAVGAQNGVTDPATLYGLAGLMNAETSGGRFIQNHNWGNVMATTSWVNAGNDFWERPHADPNQPQRFRAYDSHTHGADAWFKVLTGERHSGVLEPAESMNARAIADQLFASSYITPSLNPGAPPVEVQKQNYANNIRAGIERFQSKELFGPVGEIVVEPLPGEAPTEPEVPPPPKDQGEDPASPGSPSPSPWESQPGFFSVSARVDLPTLRMGDAGPAVLLLQTIIGAGRDGKFGPLTNSWVLELQEQHGLKTDGIVGPLTWASVIDAVASQVREG